MKKNISDFLGVWWESFSIVILIKLIDSDRSQSREIILNGFYHEKVDYGSGKIFYLTWILWD